MKLKLNGCEMDFAPGARWLDLLDVLPEGEKGLAPLGVCLQGRTLSLNEEAISGADARVLTYADEEGRRIYERSLQFLFLAALRREAPQARARIEHSFGQGLYIDISGVSASPALARRVEAQMRALVSEDLPFARSDCTKDEAVEYFTRTGQQDKVQLLKYRSFGNFRFYEMDGMLEYFYGEMVPSTGCLKVFALSYYMPGFVLRMPDTQAPGQAAPLKDMPKLMRTFAESARWNDILGCTNAADLNEMIAGKRFREFVRINEALQERTIQRIADQFISSGARLICIAGPSSSGKTTFANRLQIALRVLGKRPVKLSLDDYYLDRDMIPVGEDGQRDFERIDTLDIELLGEQLVRLLQGDAVDVPEFDFVEGRRSERTHRMQVPAGEPIVIEGIHALNDQLTASVPREMKFKIYISALTMLNLDDHNRIRTTDARLLRRIVRDHQFRGTPPEETMAMWASVRRGEEAYIFPWQEEADAMFNSSLMYELPVMKKYVYPVLCAVPETSPHYTLARRLVKFLNYIRTADVEDEIPPNSLLREFIGGSCFYKTEG